MKLNKEDLREFIGIYIRTKRKNIKWTQKKLATSVGVQKATIAKIETQGGLPSLELFLQISENLKFSVDSMMDAYKSRLFSTCCIRCKSVIWYSSKDERKPSVCEECLSKLTIWKKG